MSETIRTPVCRRLRRRPSGQRAARAALLLLLPVAASAQEGMEAPPPPPPPVVEVQSPLPPPPPVVSNAPPPSSWRFDWGGYVHVAYRWIAEPQNYALAGRNNGFQIEQARVGASVEWRHQLSAKVSLEGASEDRLGQSFPGGQLTARLRDAYITWSPLRAFRVTIGQLVTPWDLDSMRSDAELPFVSRAVPVEGVQPTEGFTTRGLGSDRSLGISIHSGFIPLGGNTSARYAVFAGNGNGQNQIVNDGNLPAVFGRAEFAFWGGQGLPVDRLAPMYALTDDHHRPIISVGVAGQWNPRTTGNLPDLIKETNVGAAADLAFAYFGFDVQAGLIYVKTSHDTLATVPDLERFGWWGHLRYTLPWLPFELTPAYRIASYAPRAHLGQAAATPAVADLDASYGLLYHTFGVTVRPTRSFPVHVDLNYTLTSEQAPNNLNNDRFEADVVAVF